MELEALIGRKDEEVLDNMLDGITITDMQGRIIYINRATTSQLGYQREECIGKTPAEIFLDEEEIPKFLEHIEEIARSGQAVESQEYLCKHKDGTRFPMSINLSVLTDNEGKPSQVLALHRDISEKKLSEQSLIKNESTLRTITDNALDAIIMMDPQGLISFWNPAAERMLGYTTEEVVGKELHLFLAPEKYHQAYKENFPRFQQTGEGIAVGNTLELEAKRKNGFAFPIELSISALKREDGYHAISVMRDISERKGLEEQLRQSQKMESIGRLAGGVAHDFNNILTVIIGNIGMLLRQTNEQATHDTLAEVNDAAQRAASLTRQLLAYSRKQKLNQKILNLNNLVEESSRLLYRVIREDIKLNIELQADIYLVKADAVQLQQTLLNLVVNAQDAMPNGGTLSIETENQELDKHKVTRYATIPEGQYAIIHVSDTGEGMDLETLSRCFDPFFTTKEVGKGTGLGLSTVEGIVRQTGGYIDISSRLGQGTTVSVYLPRCEEEIKPEKQQEEPAYRSTATILLVEDEHAVRELFKRLLLRGGHRVFEAEDGVEALKIWKDKKEEFDLVLTDVVMPRMGGSDLVKNIRTDSPNIGIIYMSGYERDAHLCEEDAFLYKPFQPGQLYSTIQKVLDRRD